MEHLRNDIKARLTHKYPNENLVNDGILVDEIYINTPVKVLFLLKETYDNYLKIQGRQEIQNGKSVPFWPNIFNWTKLCHDFKEKKKPKHLRKYEILKISKYVDNIAYVNIKKIEGYKQSTEEDILDRAEQDRHLLKYQIDEIKPEIVFTSNLDHYRKIYEIKDKWGIKKIKSGKLTFASLEHKNRLILKIHHPSFLKKQTETFNSIIDLLKLNKNFF